MIVVDASVAVKWFVVEMGDVAAHQLLQQDQTLIAPDFVIFETLNVLRRKFKRGEIGLSQLRRTADVLTAYFDRLVPAVSLIGQAVDLAVALDHTIYDCAYLACAIQHSATLATADEVLVRKSVAAGLDAHVILIR